MKFAIALLALCALCLLNTCASADQQYASISREREEGASTARGEEEDPSMSWEGAEPTTARPGPGNSYASAPRVAISVSNPAIVRPPFPEHSHFAWFNSGRSLRPVIRTSISNLYAASSEQYTANAVVQRKAGNGDDIVSSVTVVGSTFEEAAERANASAAQMARLMEEVTNFNTMLVAGVFVRSTPANTVSTTAQPTLQA